VERNPGSSFWSYFFLIATVVLTFFIPLLLFSLSSPSKYHGDVGGGNMIVPSCLSLALEDYQHAVDRPPPFWIFLLFTISLFTLGMGLLHNDTLYPCPFTFCN